MIVDDEESDSSDSFVFEAHHLQTLVKVSGGGATMP